MKDVLLMLCFVMSVSMLTAQKPVTYDLAALSRTDGLDASPKNELKTLSRPDKEGVSARGIVWLKGVVFGEGEIDIDLRGRDVFQQSFIGIAFHGTDTVSYETVYFRPFNFRSADTLRRMHAVQYMCLPDYPWNRLRKDSPLIYENAVNQSPDPSVWFHVRITIYNSEVRVYANHSVTPSLTVKELPHLSGSKIGLWNDGQPGDFSNLIITTTSR